MSEIELIKLSKKRLFELCQELGITKYKSKNKSDLIKSINSKKKYHSTTRSRYY